VDELISLERKIKELKEKAEKAELEYEADCNRLEEKKRNLEELEDSLNKSEVEITKSILGYINNGSEESAEGVDDIRIMNISIEDLEFSTRVYNSFARKGLRTILDIVRYSKERSLLSIRNIGKKCIDEVHEKLNYFGVHWTDKYLGEM
jgi:DNA-directed RNA polymerase alpha subunit